MEPCVISPGAIRSMHGSLPYRISYAYGDRVYFLAHSTKALQPLEHRLSRRWENELLQPLFSDLALGILSIGEFLRELDASAREFFRESAVVNIFLAEIDLSLWQAEFWFHGEFEVVLWDPSGRLVMPMSQLPSLGLLATRGAFRVKRCLVAGLTETTCLVVGHLDPERAVEFETPDMVKELWGLLLDSDSLAAFRRSLLSRPLLSRELPLFASEISGCGGYLR